MSALPPKADIRQCGWDVRKVPKVDIERIRLLKKEGRLFWGGLLNVLQSSD